MQVVKGKKLTLDLIFTKTKSDRLQNIKNLNLWGNDLQDLSLIEQMPNLHVVSLSVNCISSLRDFANCVYLQELYLRKNNIHNLQEIVHLMSLPNLKVLWLHDNPCTNTDNYREIVIKHLPNLAKLDNTPISPEERIQAQAISLDYTNHHQMKDEADDKYDRQRLQYDPPNSRRNQIDNTSHYSTHQEQYNQNLFREDKPKPHANHLQPSNLFIKTPQERIDRNCNIITAVMALLPQLDQNGLERVRKQINKMLNL